MKKNSGKNQSKLREVIEKLKRIIDDTPPGKRLPGSKKLAKLLNVSLVTIEKALTALESQGFIIRNPRSGTYKGFLSGKDVLLLLPASLDEYTQRIIAGFTNEAKFYPNVGIVEANWAILSENILGRYGYVFVVQPTTAFPELENIDEKFSGFPEELKNRFIFVDRIRNLNYPYIGLNNLEAGRKLGELAASKDINKALFLVDEQAGYVVTQRIKGFKDTFEEKGGKLSLHRGLPDAEKLKEYQLLVPSDDLFALKVLVHCLNLGFKIPEDLKMITFGGFHLTTKYLSLKITTLYLPLEEVGKKMAEVVEGKLVLKPGEAHLIDFGELIEGDTF